jgi:hypothetical protein
VSQPSVTTPPPLPAAHTRSADSLDVYVIPFPRDRYELFCERQSDEEAEAEAPAAQSGWWGRLTERFGVMLRAAEDREANPDQAAEDAQAGWLARLQGYLLSWVAERVAEQRLLWRLRGKAVVVTSHPDDVSFDVILPIAHAVLQKDYDRHLRWLIVDAVLLVISGILALVPGPNVLAYYFAFRVVGHWLSMRGASHGLRKAKWVGRACPILTRLRGATDLAPGARATRIHEVASQLGLDRLPRFVERMRLRR